MAPVVAALELFQTAALMHDDVLDDESMRRGRPTTHRQFAQAHVDRRDATDAQRFGVAGAILAGDLALVAAFRAIEPAPPAVRALFGQMMELVTLGQYLDMRIAAAPIEAIGNQEAEIRATMRSKTASYTAEFPLAIGAAAAGCDGAAVEAARAAGLPAGIAFQLRDDLLGIVGDPSETGKPIGGDIREGKRTIPLWHAWRLATDDQRAAIAAALGRPDAAEETVASAIAAIDGSGAIAATEAEIAAMAAQAHERVAGMSVPTAAARSLGGMLTAWGVRQA
jgi:geranylgeranyl diphosphate synthase type I